MTVLRARGIAAACVGELAAERGLERAGIGRVELEDRAVRLRRIPDGEPPLLERREVPEGAEPRAHVVQRLALPCESTRASGAASPERRRSASSVRSAGTWSPCSTRADSSSDVARAGSWSHLDEQRGELERERLRGARRRSRARCACRGASPARRGPPPRGVLAASRDDPREALGDEVVVGRPPRARAGRCAAPTRRRRGEARRSPRRARGAARGPRASPRAWRGARWRRGASARRRGPRGCARSPRRARGAPDRGARACSSDCIASSGLCRRACCIWASASHSATFSAAVDAMSMRARSDFAASSQRPASSSSRVSSARAAVCAGSSSSTSRTSCIARAGSVFASALAARVRSARRVAPVLGDARLVEQRAREHPRVARCGRRTRARPSSAVRRFFSSSSTCS